MKSLYLENEPLSFPHFFLCYNLIMLEKVEVPTDKRVNYEKIK